MGRIYYIRSVSTGRYLTVDADNNVSWQEKVSGAAQRWLLSDTVLGDGPFDKVISDGLTKNVYHRTSNSYVDIYRLTTSQKLRFALYPDARVSVGSSKLDPPGKTVLAKTNGAFFNINESGPTYEGIYKIDDKLYFESAKLVAYRDKKEEIDEFIDRFYHNPDLCISATGELNILWFKNCDDLTERAQEYEYLFPIGHALVMDGKMTYNYDMYTDNNVVITRPGFYGPSASCPPGVVFADITWDEPLNVRQRTLVGYGRNGHYYLVVTAAMSIFSCALLMKELGCTWAASLDGGGSTTMRVGGETLVSAGRNCCTAACACDS